MAVKPNITPEGYIAKLTKFGPWATPQNPIQYAFLEAKPAYLPNEPGFVPFSLLQREAVQKAFAMIAEVVDLTFVQVPDNQTIPGISNPRIAFYANSISLAYSGSMHALPEEADVIHGADIRFNNARIAQRQNNEGFEDFTYLVALHEIMHALGLSHPGDYNGQGFNYEDHAEFVEDTIQYSMMSYWPAAFSGADHVLNGVQYTGRTPLLYDILTLQSLYAPNMATRAGDTVYGFNSNTGATSPFNFAVTVGPVVAIWDGGGIDTIDLSGYSTASLIDLEAGAFSDAGGLTKNVAIAFGVTIENGIGGGGDDIVRGNAVANALAGGVGNDVLEGRAGADFLDGGLGNDVLDGGAGADDMAGGGGDDVYHVDDALDRAIELAGQGSDEIRFAAGFSAAAYTLGDHVERASVLGATIGRLTGNAADNILVGGAGDDTLDGGGGLDLLRGGGGDDSYFLDQPGDVVEEQAGEGIDAVHVAFAAYTLGDHLERLHGTAPAGGQALTGNALANLIAGSAGNDVIDGGAGADDMRGGDGDDIMHVDDALDRAAGQGGIDEVRTALAAFALGESDGTENLTGTAAAGQVLTGNGLANVITGGGGHDSIDGGGGADTLRGGAGDDLYAVDDIADAVVEHAGEGTDEVRTSLVSFTLGANLERLTGTSDAGQMLTGNALSNLVRGGGGADTLHGGGGGDSLQGGTGNDIYLVDALDVVVEAIGEGVDEVRSSLLAVTLAANVENLTGLFAGGQALTGNGLANVILGAAGHDTIDGGAGADLMTGGAGDDLYLVDDAGDAIVEQAGGGADAVRTGLAAFSLAGFAHVEALAGTGAGGQSLTGNALANAIDGAAGDDLIDGGAGADTLSGGLGDDIYLVDAADDVVVELSGGGADEVRSTAGAFTLAAFVETLVGLSAGGQSLTGNALANFIHGGAGDDVIDGGAGADVMTGGLGNDVIHIDDSADVASDAGGVDTIVAIVSHALGADFENLTLAGAGAIDGTGNGVANLLSGNSGANILDGGAGADTLAGGLGDDIYVIDADDMVVELAGQGADEIRTGLASYALGAHLERLRGTAATGQALTGNALDNLLFGGVGDDVLDGGAGIDTLHGGGGADLFLLHDGDEAREAVLDAAIDEVRTTRGSYALDANIEDLVILYAGGGSFAGNDLGNLIVSGAGADTVSGGLGDDVYIFGDGDQAIEAAGAGTDEIRTTAIVYALGANIENLTGLAASGQQLFGNAEANVIRGGADADLIDGGLGADRLEGGLGDDVYVVTFGDLVVEAGGAGYDEVRTAITGYTLADHVEKLTGTGTAQVLIGNALANFMSAPGGQTHMLGGLGDDVYIYLNIGDSAGEAAGEGTDEVRTILASTGLYANIENLVGLGNIDQVLVGNGLDNLIDGGLGADAMRGEAGNDIYVVDNVGDTVTEVVGEGIDTVRTSLGDRAAPAAVIYVLPAYVENLVGTLGGAQLLQGNALDNVITTTSGADFLYAHDGGNDILSSGAGNDFLFFGAAYDTLDSVDGGAGIDRLGLYGDYVLTFSAAALDGIERLMLYSQAGNDFDYDLATIDLNVAAGAQLEVVAQALGAGETLVFNGAAETDGAFWIRSGAGDDILIGGGGGDRISGGLGADRVTGGGGGDRFDVTAVAQSTGAGFDTLVGFDALVDTINIVGTVASFAVGGAGALGAAGFDAALAALVDAALGVGGAAKATANGGEFNGLIFVVVDRDNDGAYTAGADYVFAFDAPVQANLEAYGFLV